MKQYNKINKSNELKQFLKDNKELLRLIINLGCQNIALNFLRKLEELSEK